MTTLAVAAATYVPLIEEEMRALLAQQRHGPVADHAASVAGQQLVDVVQLRSPVDHPPARCQEAA